MEKQLKKNKRDEIKCKRKKIREKYAKAIDLKTNMRRENINFTRENM